MAPKIFTSILFFLITFLLPAQSDIRNIPFHNTTNDSKSQIIHPTNIVVQKPISGLLKELVNMYQIHFIHMPERCYTLRVLQAKTQKNYYEWLKVNKKEGVFYSFDDVRDIVSTTIKSKSDSEINVEMRTILCSEHLHTEIIMESCGAHLAKNKESFRKYTDEFLSNPHGSFGFK